MSRRRTQGCVVSFDIDQLARWGVVLAPVAAEGNADLRHAAGCRIERADIDGIGCPAAQGYRAERDRPSGCLKKRAAAWPALRQSAVSAVRSMVWNRTEDGFLAIDCHAVSSLRDPAQICSAAPPPVR
jgi:hypothetical protein